MKISVVINTRNEEKNIERCLMSVKWADEIIVVDMESTDKTTEIAKKFGAKIFSFPNVGYVEPARNFAIEKSSGDWILIIDADEVVSHNLANKLQEIANSSEAVDYCRLPRKNLIFGGWIKCTDLWPDYLIRFFKKGSVVWKNEIHSIPEVKGRGLDLEPREEWSIIHYSHESLDKYWEKMFRYTATQADERAKRGYKFDWRDLLRQPVGQFLSWFFSRNGYRDGVHGLAWAMLQAFSELVVYLRLWEKEKFAEDAKFEKEIFPVIGQTVKDINYWKTMKDEKTPLIGRRILLKLRNFLM